MRKSMLTLLLVTCIFAITAVSAMVYARNSFDAPGSMMGSGMMGRGMMGRGMMGGGMMGRRSEMMGPCGDMMQGNNRGDRPNDQWRNGGPSEGDK